MSAKKLSQFLKNRKKLQGCEFSEFKNRIKERKRSSTVKKPDDDPPDYSHLKPYEDLSKHKNPGKKRKLPATESIPNKFIPKKKACVDQPYNGVWNIDILPNEILIKIFGKLSHNDLRRIAQVSKKWNELSRCPLLWRKVSVHFRWRHGSQNEVATRFTQNLPVCVAYLKLDFRFFFSKGNDRLKFEEFCKILRDRCPSLKALILVGVHFSVSLQSVIDLCSDFLQNLEVLLLSFSDFTNYSTGGNFSHFSKLKVLDFFRVKEIGDPKELTLERLPMLAKMSIIDKEVSSNCLLNERCSLANLEILNLQWSDINSKTFTRLKNCVLKLTELYICLTVISDEDFRFSNSPFPVLKTICLRDCHEMTSEGIVSLVKSCQSVENVYVDRELALSYAEHPYVVLNSWKLQIVKLAEQLPCRHFEKVWSYAW